MCASTRRSCAPTSSRWPSTWRAPSRCSTRTASSSTSSSPPRPSVRGLPARHDARQGRQPSSTRPTPRSTRPTFLKPSPEALATVNDTEPQIGDVPRRQLRGRRHQAARLRRHLSLRRPPARSAGGRAAARDAARASAEFAELEAAPARRADRLRADVHGDRADRAAVGGLDRAQLRQPPGGADPPPDRRRQDRLDRQSLRPGAGPRARRAISPSSARPSTR